MLVPAALLSFLIEAAKAACEVDTEVRMTTSSTVTIAMGARIEPRARRSGRARRPPAAATGWSARSRSDAKNGTRQNAMSSTRTGQSGSGVGERA